MKYTIAWIALFLLIMGFRYHEPNENSLTPFVFDEPGGFPDMPTSEKNPTSIEGAELGRHLFYDPILSRDSTISCASCHKQKYAFSDGGQKLSLGIDSVLTIRNTPPLFNLAWYPALFWDGRVNSIEEQVFVPVSDHTEMDLSWEEAEKRINRHPYYQREFKKVFGTQKIDSIRISFAIAQFERTLISSNSKLDQALRGEAKLSSSEIKGYEIMNDQSMGDCLHCHPTDASLLGTSLKFSNNGLDSVSKLSDYKDKGAGLHTQNEKLNGWFKIPSVRNIAVTGPYMHDGRFESLEEVVDFYSSGLNHPPNVDSKLTHAKQGGLDFTNEEKEAVVSFLNCLTDSTFITDPRFSNPW